MDQLETGNFPEMRFASVPGVGSTARYMQRNPVGCRVRRVRRVHVGAWRAGNNVLKRSLGDSLYPVVSARTGSSSATRVESGKQVLKRGLWRSCGGNHYTVCFYTLRSSILQIWTTRPSWEPHCVFVSRSSARDQSYHLGLQCNLPLEPDPETSIHGKWAAHHIEFSNNRAPHH